MDKKNMILTIPVNEYAHALALDATKDLTFGHMCYGITASGRLLRDRVPGFVRGGVMILSDSFAGSSHTYASFEPQRLTGEIIAELSYRSFCGVFADFEGPITESLVTLVQMLDSELAKRSLTFYCNRRYFSHTQNARILVSSQVTGGSFSLYLSELCDRYGSSHLALELIPISMDFFLPSHSASGRALSKQECHALLDKLSPLPFYSRELCARYFTYMADDHHAHFVLFDDARTLASKIMTAQNIGISHCFLLYTELSHELPDILSALDEAAMHEIH